MSESIDGGRDIRQILTNLLSDYTADCDRFVIDPSGGGFEMHPRFAMLFQEWLDAGAPPVQVPAKLPKRKSTPPTAGMKTPDHRIELAPPEQLGTITLKTYDGREIVRYVRFSDRSPVEFVPLETPQEQLMGYPIRYTDDAPTVG